MADSKDNRDKKSSNVPNSSNIFSIVSQQYKDVNKIIKTISDSSLKLKDIAKIKLGIKMSKLAMKQVVKGYVEMRAYLTSQSINETAELTTSLVSDPVGFIKMLKNPNGMTLQEAKEMKNMKLFESYAKILKLLGEISEFSNNISFIGILKLPKATDAAMSAVLSALDVVRKKCKKFQPIAETVTKFINTVPNVFKTLLGMANDMNEMTIQIAKVKPKKRKKAVKQLFQMYAYIAVEMYKIGRFLITGKYTFDDPKFFGLVNKKDKVNYNPKYLIVGIILGNKFLKLANLLVKEIDITINAISKIGSSKKLVIKGLNTIQTLFLGSKKVKGLPDIILEVKSKRVFIKSIGFLKMAALMIPITVTAVTVSMLLGILGNNSKNIISGLQVFDLLFGSGYTTKKFLRKAKKTPSFLDQLMELSKVVNEKSSIFAEIGRTIGFMAMAAIALAETQAMAMMLSGIGNEKKSIVQGLKAFSIIFFGKDKLAFFGKGKKYEGILGIFSELNQNSAIFSEAGRAIGFMAMCIIALSEAQVMTGILSGIGEERKSIKKGSKALSFMFFGDLGPNKDYTEAKKRSVMGIMQLMGAVNQRSSIFAEVGRFIGFTLLLNIALTITREVASQFFSIGVLNSNIKKGTIALGYMFFGSLGPNKTYKDAKKRSVMGIMQLMEAINQRSSIFAEVGRFIGISAMLAIAFTLFNIVIDVLVDLGKNAKKAKKGIEALNVILFGKSANKRGKGGYDGIIGILQNEQLKNITFKEIVVSGAKFILLSGVFFVVGAIMSALGIIAPLVYLAGFAVRIINRIIRRMIKGLTRLQETDVDIKSSSKKLLEMSTAYVKFIGIFTGIGKGLDPKAVLQAFGLIYISPIIIRRMVRGLKKIDKHKSINFTVASKALREMSIAYTGFAIAIQRIGTIVTLGAVLTASKFILASPIIMAMMIGGLFVVSKFSLAINIGSLTLDMMTLAFTVFALGLVAISTIMAGINFAMLIPFILVVGLMGTMFAMLGLLSPAILLGTAALFIMSSGLIAFSVALLILSAAIIVFALAFQILRVILPSDDVIDEVVTGVVTLIVGVGKIVDALFEHINIGKAFLGMFAAGFVAIVLVLLIVDVVLFIVLGSLAKAITDEMINSTIRAIESIALIVNKIYETVNPIALIASIFIVLGYMILMALLFVTITLTLIVAAIAKVIDYRTLRRNLGLDDERGLIPILADTVNAINDNIKIVPVVKALIKVGLALGVIGALGGIALAVKGLSTLEIPLYDENGKRTDEKVLMKSSDFKRAQDNVQKTLETVTGIFFDKSGKPTKTMELLGQIKFKTVAQTAGLKMILSTIGGMAKTIANLSKLIVPDETKGFDKNGKPLGWRQMNSGDFDKFKENTEKMFNTITGIFNEDTDIGQKIAKLLSQITITSTIKMKLIGMTVGTIGTIAGTIAKISSMVVPDTEADGWMNAEGKIVKWRKLDENDFTKASENMMRIVKFVCGGDTDDEGNPKASLLGSIKEADIENMKMRTIKKFNKAMECMGPIANLIDTIIKISTGQFAIIDVDKDGYIKPDKNGNPVTKYLSFDQIPFKNAANKIQSIVSNYLDEVGGLFKDDKWKHRAADLNKNMKDGLPTQGISDIVDQVIKLATGQVPMIDTDENGRPIIDPKTGEPKTKYITINSTVVGDAITTLKDIISTYITKLTEMADGFANLDTTKVSSVLNSANDICRGISPILDNVEKIAKIPSKNADIFGTNLNKIITGYSVAVGNIQISDFVDWDAGSYAFMNFVDTAKNLYSELNNSAIPVNVENTFASTQKLLNKINGTDPTKLEKMADISQNMATFATSINGNFDGLAKAMNENIITALEKVNESLKDLKTYLEDEFPDDVGDTVKEALEKAEIKVTASGGNASPVGDLVKDPTKENLPANNKEIKKVIDEYNKKINELKRIMSDLSSCVVNKRLKVDPTP